MVTKRDIRKVTNFASITGFLLIITSIANQYGITVQRLEQDNGVIALSNLVPGQSIVITYPTQTHIVF